MLAVPLDNTGLGDFKRRVDHTELPEGIGNTQEEFLVGWVRVVDVGLFEPLDHVQVYVEHGDIVVEASNNVVPVLKLCAQILLVEPVSLSMKGIDGRTMDTYAGG